jgi:hypothetical protein
VNETIRVCDDPRCTTKDCLRLGKCQIQECRECEVGLKLVAVRERARAGRILAQVWRG